MASSFAPPKLADFILTERLGSGTYATVYKAYRKVGGPRLPHPQLRRLHLENPVVPDLQGDSREVVAVKVVAKKTLNKASTENLLTEIEILKSVRHPHIVQLKDFQVIPSSRPEACTCSSPSPGLLAVFVSGTLRTFI